VKQGDTLGTIADSNGISVMQLIRNNPLLYDREYIYPDETLVIAFNTVRDVQVNGYTNAYLNQDVLTRSLPYLTYLSVYNYQIAQQNGSRIISYGDDTQIIQMAKQYSTIPLLMMSALSITGDINVEYVYRLLLDTKLQDELNNELLQILRSKEYLGVNLLVSYISDYNQSLYLNFFAKLSKLLKNDGYIFIITVSPDYSVQENIDYHSISLFVDQIIFLQNIWTKKKQPPAPVSNISLIIPYIKNVISQISPEYVSLGKPLIGFDWLLPFNPGLAAVLMSLNSTIVLAHERSAVIQFDIESQTPYFDYVKTDGGIADRHKVWFLDARIIKALNDVVIENGLVSTGIWNITSYNQQVFTITNATFNIIKLLV
jgi:spore germination protein